MLSRKLKLSKFIRRACSCAFAYFFISSWKHLNYYGTRNGTLSWESRIMEQVWRSYNSWGWCDFDVTSLFYICFIKKILKALIQNDLKS